MGDGEGPVQEAGDTVAADAGGEPAAKWTWRDAVTKAQELVQAERLPVPKRPEGIGREYDFPTNARTLESIQLGTLRLQLSAFHGYTLFLIGREDVELSAFETVYELVLGDAMQKVARAADKSMVKDVLRAVTVEGDENLKKLTRAIVERRARVGLLKAHLAVYESHLRELSREQSRRESEARVGIV